MATPGWGIWPEQPRGDGMGLEWPRGDRKWAWNGAKWRATHFLTFLYDITPKFEIRVPKKQRCLLAK